MRGARCGAFVGETVEAQVKAVDGIGYNIFQWLLIACFGPGVSIGFGVAWMCA